MGPHFTIFVTFEVARIVQADLSQASLHITILLNAQHSGFDEDICPDSGHLGANSGPFFLKIRNFTKSKNSSILLRLCVSDGVNDRSQAIY